jgi:serine/threonine protein kinase/ketosteroid isomerase-like protein
VFSDNVNKLGKYEIIQELGRGAMGIVYRARDPIINRLVALKTISKGVAEDSNLLQRFYREAQSAGGLQHPNIVTIYDMGEEAGTPYIAMELVEGESLEQLIARQPELTLSLKLTYAIQACRAFDYAHKRGIIHRDIKPGNVMLNKDGTVKVVDFGIARVIESSKTQTGMLIGTFAYMSPEQYHGDRADERSDIWSFGILLYELLSYQRPFRGEAPANLMHSICEQEPGSLCEIVSEFPPELDAVTRKTLRKLPGERYQSMEDCLLDLESICKGLQSATVAKLVSQGQDLVRQGNYPDARDVLRQALQVESTNTQARNLLDKVNAELKRILIRPRAQQFVEAGYALLDQGKIQEARIEADNALQLDPAFESAQALQLRVQQEFDRSQLVSQYLEDAKLRLVEGMPEEAEAFLLKVEQLEPSNKLAPVLQEQVAKEKAERKRRLRLLETMQQARSLWTLQKYEDCVQLLSELHQEFPQEEEIVRLLETVREDQAEQHRRQTLEKARTLLAAGRHEECTVLLNEIQKQFPADDEITRLLDDVHEDQRNQQRLQGLAQARRLLAGRQYEQCISLLVSLQVEFPAEDDFGNLLQTARAEEEHQRKQQRIAKARKLLAARRYQECNALLADLQEQFPEDDEIAKLLNTLHEEEAEQRKLETIAEARNLLASRRYDESVTLLSKLREQYSEDDEIARLLASVRSEQAEQRKLHDLAIARNLLGERRYDECIVLLSKLQESFPDDDEIGKALETARRDQSDRQKQATLAAARAHLASGNFADALALLEPLRRAGPKDASVQKLLALVQAQQEKQIKAERLQQEWKVLKTLIDEKKYSEVVTRAEKLPIDFADDTDLERLVGFARAQQTHIEQEVLLRETCEKVKALCKGNGFREAIEAAQAGLKAFPGNKELLLLQESAEIQDKKLQTRKAIEQRIRDIKVKINRERFSEAIELAKQTLVTLGPNTAVGQLLSSAQVEFKTREKKRKQDKEFESIRLLVERGDFERATLTLNEALATQTLETYDPRVLRVLDEIELAKSETSAPPPGGAGPHDPRLSKEYAWSGPPPIDPADVSETHTQTQTAAPQASAAPPLAPHDSAIMPPPVVEVPSASEAESVVPISADVPVLSSVRPPPPTEPPAFEAKRGVLPQDFVAVPPRAPESRRGFGPLHLKAPQVQASSRWKRPAIAVACVMALAWAGWYLIWEGKPNKNGVITVSKPVSPQSQVNPIELRQRNAIDASDKQVAADDLAGALHSLQDVDSLNGPLASEIQSKEAAIRSAMQDDVFRKLRQQEEQWWQQAKTDVDAGRFQPAERTLRKILTLQGGSRRDDAQKYLDQVIPQRKHEEELFSRAKQDLQKNDRNSLNAAAALLEQIIQSAGPRKSDAEQLRQKVRDDLSSLDQRQHEQEIAELQASIRRYTGQGDLASARQKLEELKQAGGDTAALSSEVDKAQQEQLRLQQYETNYRQIVQKYQEAASANDQRDLEAVRESLQSFAQGGGPRAADARKYISDVDSELAALNQPAAPPPVPPAAKPSAPSPSALDDAAIRAVISQYEQAFDARDADALRAIWPNMGRAYGKLKETFANIAKITYRVQIESVEVSSDHQKATVHALLFEEDTLKGGKPQPRTDKAVYELAKSNGAWFITGIR